MKTITEQHDTPGRLAPEALAPLEETPGVSYIMPALNDAHHIEAAVRAILAQDYTGEQEILIAVGASTDGTEDVVRHLEMAYERVRMLPNPSGTTPAGLNVAIAAARHPVIIRVDAHSELSVDYARRGVEVLRETRAANCGGLMAAEGSTPFQKAVARAYMSKAGLGGPAYHAGAIAGSAESAYLGIFRREVFDVVGGFDETLRRGQDWELNLRIRSVGGLVWFTPELRVTYWPRSSWTHLVKQFHATGAWRAEIVRRHARGTSLRYFAPPLLVSAVGMSALHAGLALSGALEEWPPVVKRASYVVHTPLVAYIGVIGAVTATAQADSPSERAWLAAVLPTMHMSWGSGFLRGFCKGAEKTLDRSRLRH